ncbi:MAG: asparagine synthase (glutamine-hydrolyzing) [Anaerolineae bacterium]|nr:MAG: asparagine synthase (glutamine-hydrolyzing) [Anaerolineae bacterium]
MCGISGIVSRHPLTPRQEEAAARLNAALAHRGPNGEGAHRAAQAVLAMRRLSIIDLDGGWQPIYNEDRSLAVTCNGEIYNYIELRPTLEARGHRYSTNSDVENILHLYEEHGLDFVHHLRGMFAIALWDEKRGRLVLARDRMGEKPIYLYDDGETLYYASEMKALLASGAAAFELDPVAIHDYFHFQYVPEPATAVKGIRKLSAGHMLVVETEPWSVREIKYWDMLDVDPLDADPVQTLRGVLDEMAELVIRADVPVGVALSSGLDSSAVTTLAVSKYPGTMHAFSVGYPGKLHNDERAGARALAEHLKIPFHDVELHTEEMVACFPDVNFYRDDPIADISGFGYYMVQKASREAGIPVMLQGQGGDELFWGYDWVRAALGESRARGEDDRAGLKNLWASREFIRPTGLSRAGLGPFAYGLGGLVPTWQRYRRRTAPPPERLVFYDLARDYARATREAGALFTPNFRAAVTEMPGRHFMLERPWRDLPAHFTKLIAQTYLLENGVAQGDRLGMASSIELRLPLLDYKLVETVIGLRKARPDHTLPPKHWFKEALRGRVPDWVLERPKRGFEPPVRAWHAALFAAYGDRLADGVLVEEGILTPNAARQLASGPFPKNTTTPLSFKALTLELWARRMQDQLP